MKSATKNTLQSAITKGVENVYSKVKALSVCKTEKDLKVFKQLKDELINISLSFCFKLDGYDYKTELGLLDLYWEIASVSASKTFKYEIPMTLQSWLNDNTEEMRKDMYNQLIKIKSSYRIKWCKESKKKICA